MSPWVAVAVQESRRLLGPRAGRSLAVVLAIGLLLGASLVLLQGQLPSPERSMYSYAAAPDSPYHGALDDDPRFRQVPGDRHDVLQGDIDLWASSALEPAPTDKGTRALAAARQATRDWVEQRMQQEADEAAAFPLSVRLVPHQAGSAPAPTPTSSDTPPMSDTPTASDTPTRSAAPTAPENGTTSPPPTASTSTGPGGTTTAPPPTTGQQGPATNTSAPPGASPDSTDPPPSSPSTPRVPPHQLQMAGPGTSLLITFAYVIPMNIVGQAASSAFLQERTRRRGVLTLTAPLSPRHILAARSAPYMLLSLLVAVGASAVAGTGAAGYAAGAAIVALPLAASIVLGLLARSERELTFLLTATMTLFAFFLFLPAVFRSLPPIAYLSPLTVVLESADGGAMTTGQFLYATLPALLATLALASLAVAAYRDETLHSPLALGQKVVQSIARRTVTASGTAVVAALLVPFAFALEMLAVAFLVPLGLALLLPGFLVAVAVVEEGLKRIPILARMEHGARAGTTAAAVAIGFFVGEKLALLVAWAGLGELGLGAAALRLLGVGGLLLLALPLGVHFLTARLQAAGIPGRRMVRLATFWAAVALHFAYDAAVLVLGGVA